MMTDPIADMLTRIRNANIAMHDSATMPSSKVKEALAKILLQEGYIEGWDAEDDPGLFADRVVLLADSAKFAMSGVVRVCGPESLDQVVTDAPPLTLTRSPEYRGEGINALPVRFPSRPSPIPSLDFPARLP